MINSDFFKNNGDVRYLELFRKIIHLANICTKVCSDEDCNQSDDVKLQMCNCVAEMDLNILVIRFIKTCRWMQVFFLL